ncbi:MAG: alpha-L-fucosidase, partial [Planctomycetota bacterium]
RKSERHTFKARTLAVCQDQKPERRFLNGPVSSSIQEAIDRADPGATILVYPGTYRESVTVDVPGLTIKAARYSEATRYDEPEFLSAQKQDAAITIVADNVTIQGLSIGNFMRAGVVVDADEAAVLRNHIAGARKGTGVLVQGAHSVSVRRNRMESLRFGIRVEGASASTTIRDNRIHARNGLLIRGRARDIAAEHNDLEDNRTCVMVAARGGHMPSGVNIHYNDLRQSSEWGLRVKAGSAETLDVTEIDATKNWWGDPDGPSGRGPGQGSRVTDGAAFDPWLTHYWQPTWKSLAQDSVPEWYKDAKFGIYMHWTPACVPARNTDRYATKMYRSLKEYHTKHYGHPSEFGFKDFIPMFTLENWNPDRMAELFKRSGARFAGLTSEHHDGFAMWDSDLTRWDSADMGPRRDVAGELAGAVRDHGMKLVLSQHRVSLATPWKRNGWYSRKDDFDTRDPRFWGLYFPPRRGQRSEEWVTDWKDRLVEKVNKYRPALMWMENGWEEGRPDKKWGPTYYGEEKRAFLAEWYNKCQQWGVKPVVTYKQKRKYNYGVLDQEGGKRKELKPYWWQTDAHMGGGWFYNRNAGYKSVNRMVDNLVDRTSKRGITLLSFGPKADGTLAEPIKERLKGIGKWLDINGEAIYATRPWDVAEAGDLRFTRSKDGDTVYVISLSWPGEEPAVESMASGSEHCPREIEQISLIGSDTKLTWSREDDALHVNMPDERPCKHAWALKVELSPGN